MDKRDKITVLICDTDNDHSFTLEGALRNQNYEVVIITDATELLATVRSLKPSAVVANPDMKGFNEYDVCKYIQQEMNIPVMLILDKNSTHRARIDVCEPDDVVVKPAEADILVHLIKKQVAFHRSNP